MEIFLSAILSDLTSRSINFLIRRSSKPIAADLEDRLCRVLLRAQVILDEAMRRNITNQAMLQQLDMLRGVMHRGYYRLDTFKCQRYDEDTKKLVMFLTCYPRLYQQPYSMHLLLDNCMFGRQMEAETVINFVLYTQPHGAEELLDVLPIVGPGGVGKSTLVSHVLKDERLSSDEEVPELRIQDLMYGSVKPYGKFEILIWQSHILPYHSYVATCEIQEQKIATSKRKRSA
ncbi:hypothetical protein PR202_gb12069 [Eleusine coracana subsp. coracana]|uniref:Rx N-terminal domain-containing protein n=1 Tax=Eleusine coracana subsp. coracana TaxID=191504 RepID=A0AAV5ENB1_ELECO|nr:hypothetical protein PR202_gb12069 [Eleusine coracana subsp. coracana]